MTERSSPSFALGRLTVYASSIAIIALCGCRAATAQQQYGMPPGFSGGSSYPTPPIPGAGIQVPGMVTGQPIALSGFGDVLVQTFASDDQIVLVGPVVPPGRVGYSTQSGLQIAIAANATTQYGYQPVAFHVSAQKPSNSDRNVRIRFHVGSWNNESRAISVEQTLVLKKGDAEATATTLVPQYQDWQNCGWETFVDGQREDQLSPSQVTFSQQSGSFGISGLLASTTVQRWDVQNDLQAAGNGAASVRVREPKDLPTQWIDYSAIDVVVIPADELPAVATAQPRQFEALMRWVRSGGNLWLLNSGPRWQELSAVERALAWSKDSDPAESFTTTKEADDSLVSRGWRFAPLGERAVEPLEGALFLADYDVGKPAEKKPSATQGAPVLPSAPTMTTSQEFFAVRSHGLGAVTAFREGIVAQNRRVESLTAIQQSFMAIRLGSVSRMGNKPDEANLEFNNWLIPGVGVAPIGQFQFLISLFALTIGPLNYWWLKRRGKLPMLLATVPAAAALVTIVLIGYGLFADGLGTRVRSRSFTLLDQPAEESTTWARTTYYAGVNPRRGLTLRNDAVIFPVLSSWSMGRYGVPTIERSIAWTKEQMLTKGWLASRTPTQYLTINARASKKRLEVKKTNAGLQVGNRLGVIVTHLVVQDRDGKFHWLEGLAPDEQRTMSEVDSMEVSGKIRQLFADNYPEFPPGADMVNYGSMYSGILFSRGLMESQIEAINSPVVESWTNGSYIAVTDRGVELEFGVDEVAEEGSFHVVRGLW